MIFITPILIILFVFLLFGTFFVVKQQTAVLVERFGKYTSARQSGLQLKIPIIDSGRPSSQHLRSAKPAA